MLTNHLWILRTELSVTLLVSAPAASEIPVSEPRMIPTAHSDIEWQGGRLIYITPTGDTLAEYVHPNRYTLDQLRSQPVGNDSGLVFDFHRPDLAGRLYYGFIESTESVRHPYPVYFNRTARIDSGRATIDIKNQMIGVYDFVDWQTTGIMRLGYRVVNAEGDFLYDGKVVVRGRGPFAVDTCLIEGPFVNLVTHESAVVSFETNERIRAYVTVNGRAFADAEPVRHHEIALTGVEPDSIHRYIVHCGDIAETYDFRTAPTPGSRQPFTFAYASDGRGNNGGGERDLKGVNAYVLKRIAALCADRDVRFFQFTGDLIDGYHTVSGEMELEYANWKRTAEPFAHYLPFIAGFGNHEAIVHQFNAQQGRIRVNRFPYAERSSEVLFARAFVNPRNGPRSEDGSVYDPDLAAVDFPPYEETVYHYTYGNVAIVALNSNYWFSPSVPWHTEIGGNLHGYIMDNQLVWLDSVLADFEADGNIDHIFVTVHTPILPNGGHVDDDMWYSGDNGHRPWVAGRPVARGIIERRDELLTVLMHSSSKVKAILTGDEHNYSLLRLTDETPIYPPDYPHPTLDSIRPLWMINNGAAGAPYYGREATPWADHVRSFSTLNAVVFFHIDGINVMVEDINPDTLEPIDRFQL